MTDTNTMEVTNETSRRFHRSAETEAMLKALAELQPNQLLSYEKVREVIKEDPTSQRGRALTLSARKIAVREERVVTICEPTKGFVRVPNDKISELQATHRSQIRRLVKRSVHELAAVNVEQLCDADRTKYFTEQAWMGTIEHFSKPSMVRRIEHKTSNSKIEIGDVLTLFDKKRI